MRVLTIGGVEIAVESSDQISQTYVSIGGVSTLRTMSGGGIRQRNWRRLSTTISVPSARFLPALHALDLDEPHVIQCLARRQISADTSSITIPSARRADVDPIGYALLASGFMARTSGVLVGDVLTLVEVPGAVRYTATYVPEFLALITDLSEQMDVRAARAGWELTAEEV